MSFYDSNDKIEEWLIKHNIDNFTIREDKSVDVYCDVDLGFSNLSEVPVKFNKVDGKFSIYYNNITNLSFAPEEVEGYVDLSFNPVVNFIGVPKKIYGELRISINENTNFSLEGIDNSINEGIKVRYSEIFYGKLLRMIVNYTSNNGIKKCITLLESIQKGTYEPDGKIGPIFKDILISYFLNNENKDTMYAFYEHDIWKYLKFKDYCKIDKQKYNLFSDDVVPSKMNIKDNLSKLNKLKDYINSKVKGQKEAIRLISYSFLKFINTDFHGEHVVFIGNSGVGKTEIVNTLERYISENDLNVTVIKRNITNITNTGFKGEEITEILKGITEDQKAIVYLDEIDKLFGASSTELHEYSNRVLFNIMTFLEDPRFLFVFSGVFKGMQDANLNKKNLGFIEQYKMNDSNSILNLTNNVMKYVDENPEFLGRIPHIIRLNDVNEDIIEEIIDSKIKEFTEVFNNEVRIDSNLKNIMLDIYRIDKSSKSYGVRFLNKMFSKLEIEAAYSEEPQKTVENLLHEWLNKMKNITEYDIENDVKVKLTHSRWSFIILDVF